MLGVVGCRRTRALEKLPEGAGPGVSRGLGLWFPGSSPPLLASPALEGSLASERMAGWWVCLGRALPQ